MTVTEPKEDANPWTRGRATQPTADSYISPTDTLPLPSSSHLAFLHVVAESGSWERHDLDVEYDTYISSEDAHKHVADGSVEFVGGNHVSTYAARTRGDQWLYLGQTVSLLDHRLVVRADSGIEGVSDLKEKVVAIRGNHPGLNTWLFLKQHGLDEDRGDVKLERIRGAATWETVRDGNADAASSTRRPTSSPSAPG